MPLRNIELAHNPQSIYFKFDIFAGHVKGVLGKTPSPILILGQSQHFGKMMFLVIHEAFSSHPPAL